MPHFDEALTYLRDRSTDLVGMGRSFERLMKTALSKEPGILGDRFSQVWMWNEWPGHDGPDTGIDLVAEEQEGGLCAIQCKFFDPHRPVPKRGHRLLHVGIGTGPFHLAPDRQHRRLHPKKRSEDPGGLAQAVQGAGPGGTGRLGRGLAGSMWTIRKACSFRPANPIHPIPTRKKP